MEGQVVAGPEPFAIPNGTFRQVMPGAQAGGHGNNKIKKKVMILRKGARGLPISMKVARIRKDLSLYGTVNLERNMSEKEVRLEVEKYFFKLEDVGYKFGAADKFGRLNFHEQEEWTAANIGKWAKRASVLYVVPEVEVDEGSDVSDESSDESHQAYRQTLQKTSTSRFTSDVSSRGFQPEENLCQQSLQLNSNHGSTTEVDSPLRGELAVSTMNEGLLSHPPPDGDQGIDLDVSHIVDQFIGVDYLYSHLYSEADNVSAPIEELHNMQKGRDSHLPDVPQRQQKLSSIPTSTSSGIEEDRSDSSTSLEQSDFKFWPISTNYISAMYPDRGPLKGGNSFTMLLTQDLPEGINFPVKVKFGNLHGVTVDAFLESKNNALIGSPIPASPDPGVVTVVVETQTGQYIGETKYTYEQEDKKKSFMETVDTSDPSELSEYFFILVGKLKNVAVGNRNLLSQQFDGGFSQNNLKTQILDILEVMVYLAAEKDGQKFLQAIFSTPVGQVLFNKYKDKPTKPQDMARENDHMELAKFLDNIEQRFKQSDQDCFESDELIDWEMVIEAVQTFTDDHNQARESSDSGSFDEVSDDDSYHADDEATLSSSSDDDDDEEEKELSYILALRKLESTSPLCIAEACVGGFSVRKKGICTLGSQLNCGYKFKPFDVCITICEGLSYLHEMNVVHRDICSENILLINGSCQIVITKSVRALDYKENQSETNGDQNHVPDSTTCMPEYKSKLKDFSPSYAAPESIKEGRFSTASDVFSLAYVIVEVITHKQRSSEGPPSDIWNELQKRKEQKLIEEEMGSDLNELLEKCWRVDRRQRPSAFEVKQILDRIRNETILQDTSDRVTTLNAINQLDSQNKMNPVSTKSKIDKQDLCGNGDVCSVPKDKLYYTDFTNPVTRAEPFDVVEGEDLYHFSYYEISKPPVQYEVALMTSDQFNKEQCSKTSSKDGQERISTQNAQEQEAFNKQEEVNSKKILNPPVQYEDALKTSDHLNKEQCSKTSSKEQFSVGEERMTRESLGSFFTGIPFAFLLGIILCIVAVAAIVGFTSGGLVKKGFGYHNRQSDFTDYQHFMFRGYNALQGPTAPFRNRVAASTRNTLLGCQASASFAKNIRVRTPVSLKQTTAAFYQEKILTNKCPVRNTSEASRTATTDMHLGSLKHRIAGVRPKLLGKDLFSKEVITDYAGKYSFPFWHTKLSYKPPFLLKTIAQWLVVGLKKLGVVDHDALPP